MIWRISVNHNLIGKDAKRTRNTALMSCIGLPNQVYKASFMSDANAMLQAGIIFSMLVIILKTHIGHFGRSRVSEVNLVCLVDLERNHRWATSLL